MKRATIAVLTVCVLACGRETTMASKSAAAYREARAKGIPVTGGHEHGGHAATATGTADGGAAMDHSAHGATPATDHTAMGHGTTAGAHAAHGATPATDHAAMGHGTTAGQHAAHGATPATDHAAMGHGTARDAHAGHTATSATADHAQHRTSGASGGHAAHPPAATSAAHDQHSGMQHGTATSPADPHAQHRPAADAPAVVLTAPTGSNAMARVRPAATLRSDDFDAPAPVSVEEARKAAGSGEHKGHQ